MSEGQCYLFLTRRSAEVQVYEGSFGDWLRHARTGSSMKTSRASSHTVCKSRARTDVTFVQPMSERIKRSLLGVAAELNAAALIPTDAGLILTDWLHRKICSFDRLAGWASTSCFVRRESRRAELDAAYRRLFLWKLNPAG